METSNIKSIEFLDISVHDPVKQGEGLNSFISYKISTTLRKDISDESATPFKQQVIRRFNDFLWLHESLVVNHPGSIVPVLPERNRTSAITKVINSIYSTQRATLEEKQQDKRFLQYRTKYLQLFLTRVSQHQLLKHHPLFMSFLTLDSDALEKQKKNLDSTTSETITKLAADINSQFKKLLHITNSSAGTLSIPTNETKFYIGEDLTFVNTCKKCLNLEPVSRKFYYAEKESRNFDGTLSWTFKELAARFQTVSQMNWGDRNVSRAVTELSETLQRSSQWIEMNENEMISEVEEPLRDFYRQTKGALLAVMDHRNRRREYETAKKSLDTKLKSINESGVDVNFDVEALSRLRGECAKVQKQLEMEIIEFNRVQLRTLKEVFRNVARLEIERNKKLAAEWRETAEKVAAIN